MGEELKPKQSLWDDSTFRILMITFALIVGLAILGFILATWFGGADDIFHEAMRIIGVGGPAGAGVNGASNAIEKWRNIPGPTQSPTQPGMPPPMMKPPGDRQ